MLKDGELVGAFSIYRQEVRPFTEKQIELVKNFAAQAVIAIENARLLNELRQRTPTSLRALEQQTATSEVLQVISSSPGDLEPVFATMLEKAVRICDARFGNIYRWDGSASPRRDPQHAACLRRGAEDRRIQSAPDSPIGADDRRQNSGSHRRSCSDGGLLDERDPIPLQRSNLAGCGHFMVVPMLKDNELVGAFILPPGGSSLHRQADRAGHELRRSSRHRHRERAVAQRTRQRTTTRGLEQQTATSEVLQVIRSSPGDLAAGVCNDAGERGSHLRRQVRNVYLMRGRRHFAAAATHNAPPAYRGGAEPNWSIQVPTPLLGGSANTKRPVQIADVTGTGYYRRRPIRSVGRRTWGLRSVLSVPMLKEDELIGVISIFAKKYALSPISRSRWYRTSPRKQSSRSRTLDY